MSTKLLNCLICPKRPDFSDTSHLLTHVSSKGHLSHLHKLQVRSHQEIAAGHQLALYNQWYQEHDMGHLLSERMQQKDGKVVAKREARVKQERTSTATPVYSSNNVFENPVVVKTQRNMKPAKRELKHEPSDDDSEYISSPVKRNRYDQASADHFVASTDIFPCSKRRSIRAPRGSPNKQSIWAQDLIDSEEPSSSAAVEPDVPVTPEASKLKGVIWPGMDLFDAASFEAKRKRNQKKDSSVLKQMEKTSELIEPYEIIYSSGGTKIKERFIDGNVDTSSPLQGETPVPKSKLPKKRQPLAPLNGNAPRYARANSKKPQARTMAEVRSRARPSKLSRTHAPSSSVEDLLESTPRFTPSADENLELRLTAGSLGERKSGPSFTIYKDEDANSNQIPRLGAQNPFNAVPNQIYPARPQLSFITAPWLQPQNQYSPHMQYGNPYMAYTGEGRAYPEFQQQRSTLVKQESPAGVVYRQTMSPTRQDWTYRAVPNHSQFPMPMTPNYNFFNGFTGPEDPFGYAKNPLSAAFDQAAPLVNTTIASSSTRTPSPIKKKPVSLDGTISDHDDGKNYEQALFATSE